MRDNERSRTAMLTKACLGFGLVFLGMPLFADAIRRDASPWVWRALESHRLVRSTGDAVFTGIVYAAFYSLGFFIPYWIGLLVLGIRREGRPEALTRDEVSACRLAGFASLVFYLLFLDSILAFFRAAPTDVWNGWLILIGVPACVLLVWAAVLAFQHAAKDAGAEVQPPRNPLRDAQLAARDN